MATWKSVHTLKPHINTNTISHSLRYLVSKMHVWEKSLCTCTKTMADKLNTCPTTASLENGYYLVSPLQYGLLFENVIVIESFENDGYFGKERREHFPY